MEFNGWHWAAGIIIFFLIIKVGAVLGGIWALVKINEVEKRLQKLLRPGTTMPSSWRLPSTQLLSIASQMEEVERLLHNCRQEQHDFAVMLIHDLRTPLSVIKGYVETLQAHSQNLPPDVQAMLQVLQRNAEILSSLSEDLGLMGRLEAEPEGLHLEDVDALEWWQHFSDSAKPRYPDLHIEPLEHKNGVFKLDHAHAQRILLGQAKPLHKIMGHDLYLIYRCIPERENVLIQIEAQLPSHNLEEKFQELLKRMLHPRSSSLPIRLTYIWVNAHGGKVSWVADAKGKLTLTLMLPR